MQSTEEEGFRAFVSARWRPMVRTAYLLVGDYGHAEDLVQTALVRVHRHWRRIERQDAPEVYARKVLVNLAKSHWRRLLTRRERPTDEVPDLVVRDPAENVDLRDELWAALHELPPRMRAVLVLRYYDDLSEAETAAILGCSVGSVKSQASRGLARLRGALTPTCALSDLQGVQKVQGETA